MMNRKPRIAILYHYMFPDDVVSAQHLSGLAEDLAAHGWDVEALPCRRGCRDEDELYAPKETWRGVRYNRIWRPRFRQASFRGRLLNSAWMILSWSMIGLRLKSRRPDVVLVGTDPVFAALVAIPLRLFAPSIKLAHWCFDMHPEAAIATKVVNDSGIPARLVKGAMKFAYRQFDLIADIGVCMRDRLREYGHMAREVELTPWALEETNSVHGPDAAIRFDLFGDARLAILYSGNFGEAHSYEDLLQLARRLRHKPDIHFCLAIRGNQANALRAAVVAEDTNISFAEFAPIEELGARLGAADIHLATLKSSWAGIAVPSKFFGSLAIGRPVLFLGPNKSAIGHWIKQHEVGWTGDARNLDDVAQMLCELADSRASVRSLMQQAQNVYRHQFSRKIVTAKWHAELLQLVNAD